MPKRIWSRRSREPMGSGIAHNPDRHLTFVAVAASRHLLRRLITSGSAPAAPRRTSHLEFARPFDRNLIGDAVLDEASDSTTTSRAAAAFAPCLAAVRCRSSSDQLHPPACRRTVDRHIAGGDHDVARRIAQID